MYKIITLITANVVLATIIIACLLHTPGSIDGGYTDFRISCMCGHSMALVCNKGKIYECFNGHNDAIEIGEYVKDGDSSQYRFLLHNIGTKQPQDVGFIRPNLIGIELSIKGSFDFVPRIYWGDGILMDKKVLTFVRQIEIIEKKRTKRVGSN